MIISDDQNESDPEKKEVVNVFTQADFDTAPSFEVSAEHTLSTFHGEFINPKSSKNQKATRYSSLNSDDDDDVSYLRYDTLHVNYAHPDSSSSHKASYQCHDHSKRMAKLFQDKIKPYSLIPHPQWLFQKKKPAKKLWLSKLSTCLGKTRCLQKLTLLHKILIKLWNTDLKTKILVIYERTL